MMSSYYDSWSTDKLFSEIKKVEIATKNTNTIPGAYSSPNVYRAVMKDKLRVLEYEYMERVLIGEIDEK